MDTHAMITDQTETKLYNVWGNVYTIYKLSNHTVSDGCLEFEHFSSVWLCLLEVGNECECMLPLESVQLCEN